MPHAYIGLIEFFPAQQKYYGGITRYSEKLDRLAFFLHPFPSFPAPPDSRKGPLVRGRLLHRRQLRPPFPRPEAGGAGTVPGNEWLLSEIPKGARSHYVVSCVGRAPGGRAPAAVPVRPGQVLCGRLLNRGRRGGPEENRLEGHVPLRKRVGYRSCFVNRENLAVIH